MTTKPNLILLVNRNSLIVLIPMEILLFEAAVDHAFGNEDLLPELFGSHQLSD